MTTLLLANIGNSDLRVDEARLPAPPNQELRRWWTPRRLGEEVMANYQRYADCIELPLLEPTLRWLFNQKGVTVEQLSLYLFASDQPRDYTAEAEWLKDTAPAAEAIKQHLHTHWKLPRKAVFIRRIDGSPADYANALNFYQNVLPDIRDKLADASAQVYLEVSGGTPAMTSMLILMGVETFVGQAVTTLYLDRESSIPYEIGVAGVLFARKNRETLLSQIRLYAYAAGRETVEVTGALLLPDERRRALVAHLLGYADRRLAFDFRRALAELTEAYALATGIPQAQIKRWQGELHDPDARALLSELIHSARIKLKLGDYADFSQRLFRFQEAVFRCMAEQMGVRFGKGSQFLSDSWLASQPALVDYVRQYRRAATGKPLQPHESPIAVDLQRTLNRYSLGAIVEYYLQAAQWSAWRDVADQLFRLSSVADLRNRGIAGHGFEGIGREDLETAYGHPAEHILDDLQDIFEAVFADRPGPDPYDTVNTLIKGLLLEAR